MSGIEDEGSLRTDMLSKLADARSKAGFDVAVREVDNAAKTGRAPRSSVATPQEVARVMAVKAYQQAANAGEEQALEDARRVYLEEQKKKPLSVASVGMLQPVIEPSAPSPLSALLKKVSTMGSKVSAALFGDDTTNKDK